MNTGTSPNVAYNYAVANASTNTVRLLTVTYPDASSHIRILSSTYGAANSIDDLWDRVTQLGDSGTANMVAYTRLGLATTVKVGYAQPGLAMTYIKLSGEANGDGGDQYTGLDRFGRVVDSRWINTGSSADVNRFQYGFSRASNRLWRLNTMASTFGEQYVYDNLYEITNRKRGTLSSGVITGTPQEEEQFTLDPIGNWPTYLTKASGTTTLNQARTNNAVNEITAISPSGSTGYDSNGNMTTMPEVDVWGTAQTLTYDAWNRPITVKQGGTTLDTFAYDGLNRRTTKNDGTTLRHYYYSDKWQVLEERTGSSTAADTQYIWGIRYTDDLVFRETFSGSTVRLYALADYFQPTAIADTTGVIKERYVYRAFGDVAYYTSSWGTSTSSYAWTYLYGSYPIDTETNLYSVRNRYYHSALGRWLTRDPLQDSELSQGANLYWYVQNNATNAVDPSGLDGTGIVVTDSKTNLEIQNCLWSIWPGHLSEAQQVAISLYVKAKKGHPIPPGDKNGFSCCHAADINSDYEKDFPSTTIPGITQYPGMMDLPTMRAEVMASFNRAVEGAKKECGKLTNCCRTITIVVRCFHGRGTEKGTDVSGDDLGDLCNKSKTIYCSENK